MCSSDLAHLALNPAGRRLLAFEHELADLAVLAFLGGVAGGGDEEVERVADHWRGQGVPAYVDSVTEEPEDGGFGFDDLDSGSDNPDDRKYRQVCQLVFESQKASASWIQRQMGVGYNNASKWVERMEADGFVGPANHVGRRDIYRDKDGNPL